MEFCESIGIFLYQVEAIRSDLRGRRKIFIGESGGGNPLLVRGGSCDTYKLTLFQSVETSLQVSISTFIEVFEVSYLVLNEKGRRFSLAGPKWMLKRKNNPF